MVVKDIKVMEKAIIEICKEVQEMLLSKNAAYGNSVPDPLCVFSKSGAIERINVRVDDKLSRISRGSSGGEDAELDIIGYLILKKAIFKAQEIKIEIPF